MNYESHTEKYKNKNYQELCYEEKDYPPLLTAALAYFIKAEALRYKENYKEAIQNYLMIIDYYSYTIVPPTAFGGHWRLAIAARSKIETLYKEKYNQISQDSLINIEKRFNLKKAL